MFSLLLAIGITLIAFPLIFILLAGVAIALEKIRADSDEEKGLGILLMSASVGFIFVVVAFLTLLWQRI